MKDGKEPKKDEAQTRSRKQKAKAKAGAFILSIPV